MARWVGVEGEVVEVGRGAARRYRGINHDWRAVPRAANQVRGKRLTLDVNAAGAGVQGLPEAAHVLTKLPDDEVRSIAPEVGATCIVLRSREHLLRIEAGGQQRARSVEPI